jgi:osmoprotectant transport system ATP-binding protein
VTGPAIALEDVAKSFDGGRSYAVRDVSLSIASGQFVALVGASGSGKTTTCKFVNRLVDPDRGEVRVAGRRVDAIDPAELRRGIGYVFQGIGLFPHMSVAENIGVTPALLGWEADRTRARVLELLALVDLPEAFAPRPPHALSGGQRQRVGIARALAASPPILLMDEPFGALDPITRDALGSTCRRLHEELGLTTVMVTHDIQEAVLLADRIVVMEGGRVMADGSPAELMQPDAPPYVASLMRVPAEQARRVRARLGGRDG